MFSPEELQNYTEIDFILDVDLEKLYIFLVQQQREDLYIFLLELILNQYSFPFNTVEEFKKTKTKHLNEVADLNQEKFTAFELLFSSLYFNVIDFKIKHAEAIKKVIAYFFLKNKTFRDLYLLQAS